MNRLLTIVVNPFIISIPVAVLVIILMPPLFEKYELRLVKHNRLHEERQFYHDIDNDGIDEYMQLSYGRDSKDLPFLSVNRDYSIDSGYRHIHEINFDKQWLDKTAIVFEDYDLNGKDEMFVFAHEDDSLYLLVFRPMENGIFRKVFIGNYLFHEEIPDFAITTSGLIDLNKDNHKDLLFSITAGWSLLPRSFYVYDLHNDTLIQKDLKYAYLGLDDKSIEIDKNIGPVIVPTSFASNNFPDTSTANFSDAFSWLMVMDRNLDFLFEPIPNRDEKTGITAFPVTEDSQTFIYAYFRNYVPDGKNTIRKYTLKGELVGLKEFGFGNNNQLIKVKDLDNIRLFISDQLQGNITELNSKLAQVKTYNLNPFIGKWTEIDLDGDRNNEIVTIDPSNENLIIYRSNFSHPIEIQFPFYQQYIYNVQKCSFRDPSTNLLIHTGFNGLFYKYGKNNLYYVKYPIYLSVYLVVSFFLLILQKIQQKNLQKKYEQEKRITELELLTIKNQIDPHFTFNAINTLSSLFYKADKKTAHQYLVDFSALIRNTLNNSKKISIPLKEEVEFVQNYLKLQQIRYSNKFDYLFDIDKEVDLNTSVPRMIIQTFAENAVKHGLMNKEGKGKLLIKISGNNGHSTNKECNLKIEIVDNGIGLKESKKVSNYKEISTGHGLRIIQQILEMYNKMYKTSVHFDISDLAANEKSEFNTLVSIYL